MTVEEVVKPVEDESLAKRIHILNLLCSRCHVLQSAKALLAVSYFSGKYTHCLIPVHQDPTAKYQFDPSIIKLITGEDQVSLKIAVNTSNSILGINCL